MSSAQNPDINPTEPFLHELECQWEPSLLSMLYLISHVVFFFVRIFSHSEKKKTFQYLLESLPSRVKAIIIPKVGYPHIDSHGFGTTRWSTNFSRGDAPCLPPVRHISHARRTDGDSALGSSLAVPSACEPDYRQGRTGQLGRDYDGSWVLPGVGFLVI